jgi:hypothetical protein
MQTLEQVQAVLDGMKDAGTPAPEIIRQLAPLCLGWPYVFGAWGEQCTPGNRRKRVRDDHPTILSACPALNGSACSACKWGEGVRMFDCRGFTRWLLQQAGLDIAGSGATSQWDTAANWTQRGEIAQMPDVVCVLFRRKAGRMEHTGMHLGSGRVIHCSRNVEEGALKGGNWTHYAIPRGLYDERDIPVSPARRTLRKGAQGADVKTLQTFLIAWGCEPGTPDGIFGKQTDAALRAFQRAQGLTVDGVCGHATWTALAQPVETYTIRIEGATYQQYRRILDICPLAEATKEVTDHD